MREFTAFDPSNGSGTLDTKGINTDEQLMLYNDSINRLRFHFPDGSVGVIPALWNKDYIMKHVAMGKLDWEVIDSLNIANNPSSIVYGEIYESGEHVASVNASMQRSVVSSIPGGVNANVATLENTTSPDGTNMITIADSHGNTFVLDNNGIMQLSVLVGAALVQVFKTQNIDPLILEGATTHTIENLGNLKVDGTLESVGNITADAAIKTNTIRDNTTGGDQIDLTSTGTKINGTLTLSNGMVIDSISLATEVDYNVPNTSKHTFEVGGAGSRIVDIKSTGIGMYSGKNIGFASGSIQRIGFAAFSPPSGISTITHNFGFVPTIALWQGGQISNTNPGTTTAAIYNCLANSCTINNFAAVNGFLLYILA